MNPLLISFIVLFALNLMSFITVNLDKQKSMRHGERTPEIDFFVWAIFFSSLGVLAGMFVFHHKTQKLKFVLGIGLLLVQQVLLTYYLINSFTK